MSQSLFRQGELLVSLPHDRDNTLDLTIKPIKSLMSGPNGTIRHILGKARNAQQIPSRGMMLEMDLGIKPCHSRDIQPPRELIAKVCSSPIFFC